MKTHRRLVRLAVLAAGLFALTPFLQGRIVGGPSSGKSPFVASAQKVHEETISAKRREYVIHLAGAADMDNTTTRGCGSYDVAFQPNISLVIENIGLAPVVDPWIVINGVRDWRTADSIIAEAVAGAEGEQDKLMLLYEFIRSNRYHDLPLFERDELHDPVKHFNSYGAGLCDDMGSVTCALAFRAGFAKPRHGADPVNRSMHGHVMCEIPVNGKYQFIDTDENAFYLDLDNERPVSGDEIVEDPDLARRDYAYGPLFSSWVKGEQASALLGRDDRHSRSIVLGHEMRLTLRPGEKLTWRWDNVGKTPGKGTLKYFGNSFLDYAPSLGEAALRLAHESRGVAALGDVAAFAGETRDAFVVFKMSSPYVICGGSVSADFVSAASGDCAGIDLSMDGKTWVEAWSKSGAGPSRARLELDELLGVKDKTARYEYFLRLRLGSARSRSVRLDALAVRTVLLASPIGLPRLSLGENKVVYSDSSAGERRVRVTHVYQESGNVLPPAAPGLEYPPDAAAVRDAAIAFRWASVPGAVKYHVRVSRRPDLRTSYRPCFDLVVGQPSLCNPRTGLFNPDETYYWRVRARNAAGLWGPWSATQTFRWDGPRPPQELRYEDREGRLFLAWKPNPRGNRSVRYEVYASDMHGFRPSKEPYDVYTLGRVPGNLVATTDSTELLVVSDDPADRAPNKSSYRVIAVDANGTPSGTSAPLELPHPFVYSRPVANAVIGRPYAYQVLTLRSDGALQHRYQDPKYAFWEKEGYRFEQLAGPKWLSVNADSGLLSGTPPAGAEGDALVKLRVVRTWPREVRKDQYRPEPFLKDGPVFHSEAVQEFRLSVAP